MNNNKEYESETVATSVAVENEVSVSELSSGEGKSDVAESEATTLVEATSVETKIQFTKEGLNDSLPIMGKGMLGIFIVTAIIVLITVILNKATAPRKPKEKKAKKEKKKDK